MIDFTELAGGGRGLEQLVREMLLRMDLHPHWSGVGPDAGRDLLFDEPGLEVLGRKSRKWLVACKDNSISGAAVGVDDLGPLLETMAQHRAQAFLLVCTTHPSSAAVERLRSIELSSNAALATHVWDGVTVERLLRSPRMWAVAQSFMPISANAAGWRIFGTESPNRWVAVHRGHYFHLSKRIGGNAEFDLATLDRRIDELEVLDEGGVRIRIRGVWLDDKHGAYLWYIDCMVPEGDALPDSLMVQERLQGGTAREDGTVHDFEVEMRPIQPDREHFDIDHYAFYERLPSFV